MIQKDGVDDAEHGRVGADAEGQQADGDRGECRVPPQGRHLRIEGP
jgi:hypothetical protein